MSNEMPTVLVGLVHLHDSVLIEERLFFFGELVRFAGTKRYTEGGRHNQQQSEGPFVHGESSERNHISFRLFDRLCGLSNSPACSSRQIESFCSRWLDRQ